MRFLFEVAHSIDDKVYSSFMVALDIINVIIGRRIRTYSIMIEISGLFDHKVLHNSPHSFTSQHPHSPDSSFI